MTPETCALTAMQESMLFSTIAELDGSPYLGQVVCRIDGPVDARRLQNAWEAVCAAHSALRTAFLWKGLDRAVQVVHPEARIPFTTEDFAGLSPEAAEDSLQQFLAEDRERQFDLSRAPLMRVALLGLPDRRHVMVWSLHHIILDGASVRRVLADIASCYSGKTPDISAPAFRETVAHRERRDCAATDAFWRRALAEVDEPTPLFDPQAQGAGHRWITQELTATETAALHGLCATYKLTPASVFVGAWAVLLARFTRERPVVFGLSVSGRSAPLEGVERAVGPYMNTLPFAVDAGAEDTDVASFLRRIQIAQVDLQSHDHSAQSDIKKATGLRAEDPLYDTLVSIGESEAPEDTAAPHITAVEVFTYSNQPMALLPKLGGAAISMTLVIDQSRFSPDYGDTVITHLRNILNDMTANAAARLSEIAAAAPLANDAVRAFDTEATLNGLIEAAASRRPDAVAVIAENRSLTYGHLLAQAKALAGRLQEAGVTPGAPVALLMKRSEAVPVGMLGILLAGAAFVPLDPAYPVPHHEHVIADAGTRHMVVGPGCAAPAGFGGAVLSIDDGDGGVSFKPVRTHPDDLAYIVYTSGSTGVPKGVAISHRNITASNLARRSAYEGAPERFLVLSSQAFDSALVGLIWPLIEGGTVVLPPPDTEKDIDRIAGYIAQHAVSHVLCIPSLYRLVLDHAEPGRLQSLKSVFVAGETCPPDLAGRHFDVLPGAELHNEFGPTETAIWCATAQLLPQHAGRRAPIGRPSPACDVTIRDSGLRLLPPGIVGEICVAGPCVAQGYVGDPDKSHDAFVPLGDGARLYRTGDLGYVGRDGLLYCLGRDDEQVKIRGFRVEPAQVAATLESVPGIREAVVIARDDAAPDIAVEALVAALERLPAEDAATLLARARAQGEGGA